MRAVLCDRAGSAPTVEGQHNGPVAPPAGDDAVIVEAAGTVEANAGKASTCGRSAKRDASPPGDSLSTLGGEALASKAKTSPGLNTHPAAARRAGAAGEIVLRVDSGFLTYDTLATLARLDVRDTMAVRSGNKALVKVIGDIDEDAWADIDYPPTARPRWRWNALPYGPPSRSKSD